MRRYWDVFRRRSVVCGRKGVWKMESVFVQRIDGFNQFGIAAVVDAHLRRCSGACDEFLVTGEISASETGSNAPVWGRR
jgi:hypothetical protein